MAEPYRTDYLRTPNSQRFTRQRLMFPLVRALQRNAQHLWGTRVQPLVKDFDRFETIPAAFDAAVGGTSPEYYVLVSRGATRLLGTILWKSVPALSLSMLTRTPKGGFYLGKEGGILNAIAGSLYLAGSVLVENG